MAEIDIRTTSKEEISTIRFGDGMTLEKSSNVKYIIIEGNDDESVYIEVKDIDNLILALQKAKELWGNT